MYNARKGAADAPDLALRIQLRSEGRLIHEFLPRPVRPGDDGSWERVRCGARLSLSGLPRGEYELRAIVEGRTSPTTAERSADFVVE